MSPITRRGMLAGLAALGGSIAVCGGREAPSRRWIDVHHHFIPPSFREFYTTARTADGDAATPPPMTWDVEADLEDMDRSDTRLAILSIFVPYDVGTPTARAHLARQINEYAFELAQANRGRFACFGALPMPDVSASLAELEYAFDSLKVVGVALYSNFGDRWLGDSAFEPLYAELNRRKAVVLVHPTTASCCHRLLPAIPDNIIEYGTDTTRAIANVIFEGVSTRYPDIQFIFSHGGGTMPYLIERFLGGTASEIVPGIRTSGQPPPYTPNQPPGGALAPLRRMHYDTAQCSNPIALRALRDVVGTSQMLYGTDYFYRTAVESARAVVDSKVFSSAALTSVAHANALRLMPGLES